MDKKKTINDMRRDAGLPPVDGGDFSYVLPLAGPTLWERIKAWAKGLFR